MATEDIPDWVDFELGEDVRDESRLEQDRQWSQAVSDGRGHFSNREFALQYGDRFLSAIQDFEITKMLIEGMFCKDSILKKLQVEVLAIIVSYALPGQGPLVRAILHHMEVKKQFLQDRKALPDISSAFKIVLRKRPLNNFEIRQGAYDVTQVGGDTLLLHEGKLARNGRLLSMTHHQFAFDRVFDEAADNAKVCAECVAPMLRRLEAGRASTLVCFGQTGTGKTYTLYGALAYLAQALEGRKGVKVVFYEVHGNNCYDLLNQRNKVHLRFDASETAHVRGAHCIEVPHLRQAEDLMAQLRGALALRASEATERNAISSRSHAVCSITYGGSTGKITLVDLAGSERNADTGAMTGAQHKESAEINLALMALKNCFHAFHHNLLYANGNNTNTTNTAKLQRIPYRASTLTKVLKDCFVPKTVPKYPANDTDPQCVGPDSTSLSADSSDLNLSSLNADSASLDASDLNSSPASLPNDTDKEPAHYATLLATISPSAVDLQHTLNTIQHVLLMSQNLGTYHESVSVEIPKTSLAALSRLPIAQWSAEQVSAWLATVEHAKFAQLVLPPQTTGQVLLGLSISNLCTLFEEQERSGRQAAEGPRWVIGADETSRVSRISQQLFYTIRREERFYAQNSLQEERM